MMMELRLPPAQAKQPDASQLVALLRTSIYPDQRELIVNALATQDWRSNPQIVPVLLASARDDESVGVRIAAIRSLAEMNAGTQPVIAALLTLRGDGNPRIQQEAYEALAKLNHKG